MQSAHNRISCYAWSVTLNVRRGEYWHKCCQMILRKILFLILVVALSLVPVLQAAHALTHVGDADLIGNVYADGGQEESGLHPDSGLDGDKICLDCLALTGFSIAVAVLPVFFFDQMRRQPPPYPISAPVLPRFSSPYFTRGPPQA
ncbi:hypothetical protein SAMN05720354_11355 [Nitrosospira sp. Nsp1]|nr:hypothetical protein SAMN05720354_11355 [Nitrosospira sp. Nsp1]